MSDVTGSHDDLPRQTSTVERTVTVLLMVGLAVLVPFASLFGLFFGMGSDGCVGDSQCSTWRITAGIVMAAGSPWLVYLAALVVVIVRWARRLRVWWVPVAALAIGAALWALGGFIAVSGVG